MILVLLSESTSVLFFPIPQLVANWFDSVKVSTLDFSGKSLGDGGIAAVAKALVVYSRIAVMPPSAPSFVPLTTLSLRGNALTDHAAVKVSLLKSAILKVLVFILAAGRCASQHHYSEASPAWRPRLFSTGTPKCFGPTARRRRSAST